jgi:hypothetical protein
MNNTQKIKFIDVTVLYVYEQKELAKLCLQILVGKNNSLVLNHDVVEDPLVD